MDVGTMAVKNGCKEEVQLMVDSQTADILMGEKDQVSVRIVKDIAQEAPVETGKEVGKVYYRVNEDIVRQFPIVTGEAVPEKTFDFVLNNCCVSGWPFNLHFGKSYHIIIVRKTQKYRYNFGKRGRKNEHSYRIACDR